MKKAVRVYIFGIVQGVTFRGFVKTEAEKLGINGYVRNKEDGSIEIWLEGNSGDVNKMVEVCKQGPSQAVVKRLDIINEPLQDYKKFKVMSF